ncbi:MAG TPA: hypothetical protein VNT22_02925, partial [Baekduia sp.]|nr:hypothetical protein [Baekduia sp.]
MRYKAAAMAALAVAAGGILAACGSDDNKSGGGGSAKPLKIAFLATVLNDYSDPQEKGMTEVAKRTGGSMKAFNANFDPVAQGKQCTDAIT